MRHRYRSTVPAPEISQLTHRRGLGGYFYINFLAVYLYNSNITNMLSNNLSMAIVIRLAI